MIVHLQVEMNHPIRKSTENKQETPE
jgi:hypothetical protein